MTAILATTRLAPLAERYPAELSGGQQQRVSLARALIVEPDTLLLDEPLSNLDANLREEMRFEVRRLHDAYRYTTIYVTHDQSEAMTTADLIAVMNAGRIEQLGTPQEVYEQPRSEFVARFLGGSNIIPRPGARCRQRLAFAGAPHRVPRRAIGAGRRRGRVGAPARDPLLPPSSRPPTDNALQGTVVRNVFLGAQPRLYRRSRRTARSCASPRRARARLRRPARRCGCICQPDRCRALVG